MQTTDIERAFVYRVFFRRGGKTIAQSFVDAKNLGVSSDWFSDAASRVVWDAADEMFSEPNFESLNAFKLSQRANSIAAKRKGRDYEGVTIGHNFFDNYEKSVNGADDLNGFCQLIRNAVISRKTLEACQAANDAFTAGDDATSAASALASSIQSILSGVTNSNQLSVASLVDSVIAQYDDAYHHVQELGETDYTPGLSLPFKKLSYAMNGFPSVLTVVAARPGVGKTSFAVELMRYWMDHGVKVVFDTLDMAGVEYMKRQIAEMTQVSSRKLQFGKTPQQYWEGENGERAKVVAAGEALKKLERDGILTVYTEHDVDKLVANVKILKDQGKIDVLVVDYIQKMTWRGADKFGDTQRISHVSQALHRITTELGVPVLALAQINRDSSKEGVAPQIHDLKGSGEIEQDASNVIILHPNWALKNKWRDNPPTQFMRNGQVNASAKALMPMWVILAKAREGESGTEIPFVVVQNKYSWYQGDYEADTKDEMFAKVWDNWKHDEIERVFDQNGALIKSEEKKQIEQFNAKHALPPPKPLPPPPPVVEQQNLYVPEDDPSQEDLIDVSDVPF